MRMKCQRIVIDQPKKYIQKKNDEKRSLNVNLPSKSKSFKASFNKHLKRLLRTKTKIPETPK